MRNRRYGVYSAQQEFCAPKEQKAKVMVTIKQLKEQVGVNGGDVRRAGGGARRALGQKGRRQGRRRDGEQRELAALVAVARGGLHLAELVLQRFVLRFVDLAAPGRQHDLA